MSSIVFAKDFINVFFINAYLCENMYSRIYINNLTILFQRVRIKVQNIKLVFNFIRDY